MKTPSFRYMGGKARLASWLVGLFPKTGNRYVEMFAGRGNVFFKAKQALGFREWHLNDLDIGFFRALLSVDLDGLPETVSKEDFAEWKGKKDGLAALLEPRITFGGKGYRFGGTYSGDCGGHVGYSKGCYKPVCEEARRLLQGVALTETDWEKFDLSSLGRDDFVYCDPPYVGTKASYPNIDHEKLIERLNSACFRWALSGYESGLYDSKLKPVRRYAKVRNSEIKSSNTKSFSPVTEVLSDQFRAGTRRNSMGILKPIDHEEDLPVLTDSAKEMLKDAGPLQIKEYGNLDSLTIEAMMVGYLVDICDGSDPDTKDAEKILDNNITKDMFEDEALKELFENSSGSIGKTGS